MSSHVIFLLFIAFLNFIVVTIALVLTIIAGMREKVSDRPSGGCSFFAPRPIPREKSANLITFPPKPPVPDF